MYFRLAKSGLHSFSHYAIGVAMVILAVMLGNLPIAGALMYEGIEESSMQAIWNSGINFNVLLTLLLMPFVFGFFALCFVIKRVHRRRLQSAFTSRPKFDWNRVFVSFGLWFGINLAFHVVQYFLDPEFYEIQTLSIDYLILVLVALVFFPLQIAFEELMFRGYLLQGLGLLSNKRWMALLMTSVAFGLMHMANPEVSEYGTSTMMTYYIGTGLILGLIVIMDEGLELVLGIHAATNIFAAVVVSYDSGAIPTRGFMHSSAPIESGSIITFLITSAVFMLILSKIYKWRNWNRLFTPIFSQNEESE